MISVTTCACASGVCGDRCRGRRPSPSATAATPRASRFATRRRARCWCSTPDPGIVGLGHSLSAEDSAVPILLTHYHWDHTQGLPFFAPFFDPGWHAVDLGAAPRGRVGRVGGAHFRVAVFSGAVRAAAEPAGGDAGAGGHVRDRRLPHQRAAAQPSRRRVRLPDSRRRAATWSTPPITSSAIADLDEQLAAFCLERRRAVISDAHFTPEELPRHDGWGHASWRQVPEFASACGAGHLWLFHHKPGRTDHELALIEVECTPRLSGDDPPPKRGCRSRSNPSIVNLVRKLVAGLLIGAARGAHPRARCLAHGAARQPGQKSVPDRRAQDLRLAPAADGAAARRRVQDIALVEIDEYSLRNLEPLAGRWPWPRLIHSMILDYLARGPAKVIVYDVVFAGADPQKASRSAAPRWTGAGVRRGAGRLGQGSRQRHPAGRCDLRERGRRRDQHDRRRAEGRCVTRDPAQGGLSALRSARRRGRRAGAQPDDLRPGRSDSSHGAVCANRVERHPVARSRRGPARRRHPGFCRPHRRRHSARRRPLDAARAPADAQRGSRRNLPVESHRTSADRRFSTISRTVRIRAIASSICISAENEIVTGRSRKSTRPSSGTRSCSSA